MGRGPLLRTKLKELKKRIETEFKTRLKLYKKHPEVWIGDRLADIAKRTGMTDVAEIVAVVGMTILVKKTIDTSEELRGALEEIRTSLKGPFVTPIGQVGMWSTLRVLGVPSKAKQYEGMFPDWADWLISFALAYMIIKHFGAIMQTMGAVTSSVRSILQGLMLGGVPAG